ncbi:MAG: glycosyltransferase family 4 protein [Thermoleophilia bacterium]
MPGRTLVLVENLSVPFDRRVRQECLALRRAGWEVSVICPMGQNTDRDAYEEWEGVHVHRYPLTPASGGPLGYVREYGTMFRHTRRLALELDRATPFDVVQACNPPDLLLLAVGALKRRGAAMVFDHHDLVPELYESRFDRGRDLLYGLTVRAEAATFRRADVVISTNESYRRVALERGGKAPEDVFVVRSAPDLSRFVPSPPDPSLAHGKEHLLAYLGVMGPQDGVDHALRALAHLRQRRDDWHAVFIGGGDVYDEMRALARELGIGDAVDFPGRIPDEDVTRILSTADVCLAPDPKNPLNDVSTMNKIVEYMAMSRPIVSYELIEARESAGDAAIYVTTNDERAFADGIARLLDDPAERRRMGELGRQRVEQALSWEHSERNLLAAYERALGRARRR